MRYSTRYHPDRDLVICTIGGEFSIEDALRMLDDVAAIDGVGPLTAAVIDARPQTGAPSADDVARIVERLRRRPFRRVAIVPARAASYGTARMLVIEASSHQLDAAVFTDFHEAVTWAGRQPVVESNPKPGDAGD